MQTTVIIQDEMIVIYHQEGPPSSYHGKASTEVDALKAIKKIIMETNRTKAIGDTIAKADVKGAAVKALGKLKPLKAK